MMTDDDEAAEVSEEGLPEAEVDEDETEEGIEGDGLGNGLNAFGDPIDE